MTEEMVGISGQCRGEDGKPQQFPVQATFFSFFRQIRFEILVLRLLCIVKFIIFEDKTIFQKSGINYE